jgi:hypothetical protein
MMIEATIGNIFGCATCIVLSVVTFFCFKMSLKLVRPQANPDDVLGIGVVLISLCASIFFALVPVSFLLIAYLERNPQVLDVLRF